MQVKVPLVSRKYLFHVQIKEFISLKFSIIYHLSPDPPRLTFRLTCKWRSPLRFRARPRCRCTSPGKASSTCCGDAAIWSSAQWPWEAPSGCGTTSGRSRGGWCGLNDCLYTRQGHSLSLSPYTNYILWLLMNYYLISYQGHISIYEWN